MLCRHGQRTISFRSGSGADLLRAVSRPTWCRDPISLPGATAAVVLAWSGSLATLLLGNRLAHFLGRRGVVATERLMSMVLCVIAVHILLSGLESYFSIARAAANSSS